jgi:hypothetical protein
VKGAGCSGSAGSWLKACIAGDAPGDWLSFRPRERSMPQAGDGAGCERRDVQRLVLAEVRDECSFGDPTGGVGDSGR